MKVCVYNSRKCVVCRRPIPPEGRLTSRECLSPGLGDMVASGLSAIGITKELVERIVGGPCGCDERQEWLNQVGRQVGIGTTPEATTDA